MQRSAWFIVVLMFGLAQSAQAQSVDQSRTITIDLRAHGAVELQIKVKRPVDAANFCSASADPWGADQRPDTRSAPFPFYRVVFGKPGPGAPLDLSGPSLAITLSRWLPPDRPGWTEEHEDPANDTFDMVIEDRHFVGHGGLPDPAPRMLFAWRDDGGGGGFLVTGLQEVGGDALLDVEGTWSCPPIEELLPEVSVQARRSPPEAVPATAAPPALPFRLRRIGSEWWVTAPDGETRPVSPDLARLRLASTLRTGVEQGQLVLLVQGELRDGVPLRLVARRLQGVMPAPTEGASR